MAYSNLLCVKNGKVEKIKHVLMNFVEYTGFRGIMGKFSQICRHDAPKPKRVLRDLH